MTSRGRGRRAQNPQMRDLYNMALRKLRDNAARFTPTAGRDRGQPGRPAPAIAAPEIASLHAPSQGKPGRRRARGRIRRAVRPLRAPRGAQQPGPAIDGQRFGVLAGSPAFDAEHLPFGPHAMATPCTSPASRCRCRWKRACRSTISTTRPRWPTSTLLEALNARLADDGVLPHLSFVPVRVPGEYAGAPVLPATTKPPPVRAAAAATAPARRPAARSPQPGRQRFRRRHALWLRRIAGGCWQGRTLLAKLRPAVPTSAREALPGSDVLSALAPAQRQPEAERGGRNPPEPAGPGPAVATDTA